MKTRLYYIVDEANNAVPHLVEATSREAAIRHLTRDRFTCDIAKPKDVAHAMSLGAKVENAIAAAVFADIVTL